VLAPSKELDEVVAMGATAVPHLLGLLAHQPAKVVAYLVLALRRIGSREALEELRSLRSHYQALDSKGEWEFAVIGQCNLAIQTLERHGQ